MYIQRLFKLIFGILLFAIGIVLSINANLGIAPWDAFHQGLSKVMGISFGIASIGVGLCILVINYFLQEKIGLGTIINIVGIGLMIDQLFYLKIIPIMHTLWTGLVALFISMFIISIASYFYIGAGFGAGPRDGLMIGLVKKTGQRVGIVRGVIELTALGIGFLLGGEIGIGTLILGISIGPIMQYTFKLLHFDVSQVKHQYFFSSSKYQH